jgi:hypothetical protein
MMVAWQYGQGKVKMIAESFSRHHDTYFDV